MVFSRIVKNSGSDTARFRKILGQLFETMATGGDVGMEPIRHFNGNLFDDCSVLDLTADEMRRVATAANLDWSAVDPSIFGTLFERGLDPAKRAELGVHFTGREDIDLVVDAVMMSVLGREWEECRATIGCLLATGHKTPSAQKAPGGPPNPARMKKARGEAGSILHRFMDVRTINANLNAATDTVAAAKLASNVRLCFVGTTKKAPLDIDEKTALALLLEPNPTGRPSSDVIVPYLNAEAVASRDPHTWIIDFLVDLAEQECQGYGAAFEHVHEHVFPLRANHREPVQKTYWWRLARPCPDMFLALRKLDRFLVTTIVSKHRLFAWRQVPTNPDHALAVFARADDYFFGVLHSRIHEVWALHMGTRLETRPRYTPTTCFETFPFPFAADTAEEDPLQIVASFRAAHHHFERDNVLREEPLEFPGTVGGPWDRYIDPATAADRGGFRVGTVRYPRLVARDAKCAARLKDRTLTKLYNARPAWLAACHAKLDAAVAAAYGWPADLPDEDILERLLALNQAAAG